MKVRCALFALFVLGACGCAKDPVATQVEALEKALRFQDAEALHALHKDRIDGGALCSEGREGVFKRTAQLPSERACKSAASLIATKSKISEEAMMAARMVDYHCRVKDAKCTDFAREDFLRRAKASKLFARPADAVDVENIEREGNAAKVYALVRYPEPPREARVVLTFEKSGETYWLTNYPW